MANVNLLLKIMFNLAESRRVRIILFRDIILQHFLSFFNISTSYGRCEDIMEQHFTSVFPLVYGHYGSSVFGLSLFQEIRHARLCLLEHHTISTLPGVASDALPLPLP